MRKVQFVSPMFVVLAWLSWVLPTLKFHPYSLIQNCCFYRGWCGLHLLGAADAEGAICFAIACCFGVAVVGASNIEISPILTMSKLCGFYCGRCGLYLLCVANAEGAICFGIALCLSVAALGTLLVLYLKFCGFGRCYVVPIQ